jgi:hypothetical protein
MLSMGAYEELDERLKASNSAPFLFVGAGVSRRYLDTDGWVDLLKRMAAFTDRPYAYYASKANGELPNIASEIAAAFHEIWWTDPRFEESRALFSDGLTSVDGPLKVEVARYAEAAVDRISEDGPRGRELALIREAVVDGAITTNYDSLLERLFPDYKTYVGQNELLFSDSQGVGEIYKIHGSATLPESLVLTAADYEAFNERNPYLAAKLLTIFVEHPVIFVGYSLTDPNVTSVLVSVAKVLTTDNLNRLRDRLIFVKWDEQIREPSLVPTQIAVSGFTIPVLLLAVPDFEGLFEVLSKLPRKFPARLLRQLKEHVYDLVLSKQPDTRLAVVDIEDDTRANEIDVVFGVGVQRRLGQRGYVGLSREDLLRDVLAPTSDLDARKVVDEALPRILRTAGNTPVYRYLRSAGLLRDDGTPLPDAQVDSRIAKRVSRGLDPFNVPKQLHNKADRLLEGCSVDFEALLAGTPLPDVLLAVTAFPRERVDVGSLRRYLIEHADAFSVPGLSTAWAKAVCLYDYYRFGAVDLPATDT